MHELLLIIALSITPPKLHSVKESHLVRAYASAHGIRRYQYSTSRKSQHSKFDRHPNILLPSFAVTINHEAITMVDPAAMRRVQAASKRLELALQGRPAGPPPNIPQKLMQMGFHSMIGEICEMQEERVKEDQVSVAHPINMDAIDQTFTGDVHSSSFAYSTTTRGEAKGQRRGHEGG